MDEFRAFVKGICHCERSGYGPIPNYGQYVGIENSVCMQKALAVG